MSNVSQHRFGLAFFAPWLFVFLWSTGFIAAKFTIQYAPPFKLLFLRGLFSCIVFLALAIVFRVKFPSFAGAAKQIKAGFLLHAVFLGGCFFAIHRGMPSSLVALITGIQPLLTAILLSVFSRQSFRFIKWLGIIIGLGGVSLVLSPGKHALNFDVIAIVSAIIGLLGVTLGSLYQKKITIDGHIFATTFFQYISLTVVMGFVSSFTESQPVDWNLSFILGMLWLVIGISVSAILLFIYMIRMGEATKVASYFYLVPVVTAILAWLIIGEPISIQSLIGMGITILGMVFVMLG